MKTIQKLFILLISVYNVVGLQHANAQGWIAVIDLDLNHELYAFEKITNASVTYSGVTKIQSSETSSIQLIIHGSGHITGDISLTIDGIAFEPYYSSEPYSEPISAAFSGSFTDVCTRGFFENDGESIREQISIWIEVYPRLEIDHFVNNCNELSFITNTCSKVFLWEVGDSIDGVYKAIKGKNTSGITVTRNELISLGFSDPYGRKFFRVTGLPGTTSQIQPLDVYYPPPSASVEVMPPKCHNGSDGSIFVNIASSNQSAVNDFVVTLFPATPGGEIRQVVLNDKFIATFESLAAGTYRLRIENNSKKEIYGACWVDMDVEPLNNPSSVVIASFELSDYNGYAIRCNGGSDGQIKIIPQGGTGVYAAYEWSREVSSTAIATNLSEGIYEAKVKDSNGCWSPPRSQRLTSPEKLTVSLTSIGGRSGFDVSCADKADGAIETLISGGVPGYTFQWSNGATEKNLINAAPGSYMVKITDTNGCATTGSTTLHSPVPIDFSISEISGIICAGQSSGMLEVQAVTNAIGEVHYSWSTGASEKEIANLPSGVYAASVSDDHGCVTTKHHTLRDPAAWIVNMEVLSDYNGSPIRCNGDASGQLKAVVTDGQQNIVSAQQYTWYRNNELISGATSPLLSGLSAGIYRAEITYRDFCKAGTARALEEPGSLKVTVFNETDYNGMAISCYGRADGSLRAMAEGGTGDVYGYSWTNGHEGPLLNGVAAGTYVVTARDINGCEGTTEKILEQPDPVKTVISVISDYNGQSLSCDGSTDGRIRASATGGAPPFTYLWNSVHTTQELMDIPAGHYFLTATDANGCISGTDIILRNPRPVEVNIAASSDFHGYGISCYGASDGYALSTASGGTGHYDFLWEGAQHTGPLYENLRAGTYTVTAKDQNGCVGITKTSITEPAPIKLESLALKNVSCSGGADGEIKLSSSGGAGAFLFSASGESWQVETLLGGLEAGTYHPIAMDVNGCKQVITATITSPLSISIHFEDIQPALCGEPRGMVSSVVRGGTGSYSYEWKNSDQEILSSTPQLSDLPAGIITLRVLDEHLCEATKTVGITSADGPLITIINVSPVACHDAADGKALVTAEGNHPFTFIWQDGQTTSEGMNLKKGEHLVEVIDANNCAAIESVVITAPDSIQVELVEKAEPLCNGDCNGKLSISGKGGNGNYSFVWKDFTGPEAANLCAGRYDVKISDQRGCKSSKTFWLTEPEPINVKAVSAIDPVCINGCDGRIEVQAVGGTGNLDYLWATGPDRPEIMGLCAGTYSITVTDEHQCAMIETFTIADPAGHVIDLGGSITLCAGQTHILDPGPFWEKYSWGSTTGLITTEQRIKIADAGMYWLEATSNMGCIAQDTFFLETSADLLNANFLLASEAKVPDTVVMIDISWPLPDAIAWTLPPEFERLHDLGEIVYGKFEYPGEYSISLQATLGECSDEIAKSITVHAAEEDLTGEGRLGRASLVKDFTLYPNPNDGSFDVVVEFADVNPMTLSVWNALTGKKISHNDHTGDRSYLTHIDLKPLSSGPYTLRLDYEHGARYIRFIVR